MTEKHRISNDCLTCLNYVPIFDDYEELIGYECMLSFCEPLYEYIDMYCEDDDN